MKITPKQKSALDDVADAGWRAALASHLREEFPEECASFSAEDLDKFIARAIERAESYGIDESQPLAQFAVLCLTLGANFDDDPDIKAYLEDAVLEPEDKMNALLDAIEAQE